MHFTTTFLSAVIMVSSVAAVKVKFPPRARPAGLKARSFGSCPAGSFSVENSNNCSPQRCPGGTFQVENTNHCVFSCPAGSYRVTQGPTKFCAACPAGNSCQGSSDYPEQCDVGYYQPLTGKDYCNGTLPGFYQPEMGKNVSLPCPAGTYQPHANKGFCYGATSGRFQNSTGQTAACGVCCGWFTTEENNNKVAYRCPAGTSAGRGSGSGCTTRDVGCVKADTCAQFTDGTCPDLSFYD
ncbi:hypothetical protein C8J57DRAFT_1708526 [Mycena rebaudengoi]|nr:hypothetical protein C8J57DRAFT_1708526 [Mycena rebaudengoi]